MNKHTEGPWLGYKHGNNTEIAPHPGNRIVAIIPTTEAVRGSKEDDLAKEQQANALLISFAPAMLDALKRCNENSTIKGSRLGLMIGMIISNAEGRPE